MMENMYIYPYNPANTKSTDQKCHHSCFLELLNSKMRRCFKDIKTHLKQL